MATLPLEKDLVPSVSSQRIARSAQKGEHCTFMGSMKSLQVTLIICLPKS